MRTTLRQFMDKNYAKRRLMNRLVCMSLGLCAGVALLSLGGVFCYLLMRGAPSINLDFFLHLPRPVGENGGGMANAIGGSAILVAMASFIGIPWGILTGILLAEYGRGKVGMVVRFSVDMLSSVPSIVIGLFVYVIVVRPMHRFSAIAGSFSLAILMVPTIARTTEELFRLVPQHIREAGLALGIPRWKVTLKLVLKGVFSGVLTGIMLSIARVAGETAPLLFTALNNRFWSQGIDQPIASLPVQIFSYAVAPYSDWNRQAWAGALVLVLFVFAINIITRGILRPKGAASRD